MGDLLGGALDLAGGIFGGGSGGGTPLGSVQKTNVIQSQTVGVTVGSGEMGNMIVPLAIGGVAILAIALIARR